LLNAGNDVQRWWRLVYTVLTGMVELLRVGIMYDLFTVTDGDQILPITPAPRRAFWPARNLLNIKGN